VPHGLMKVCEEVIALFEVLYRWLHGEMKENHVSPQSQWSVSHQISERGTSRIQTG